jgi:translocation and assembly module TamB
MDAIVLGKKLEAAQIAFKKTKDGIDVEHTKIKLGGISGEVEAKTHNGKLSAFVKTDSTNAHISGVLDKELRLKINSNLQGLATEYAKIMDTKRQNIAGDIAIDALIKGDSKSPNIDLSADSKNLEIGGEQFENTKLSASLTKEMLNVHALSFVFQNKDYRLTNPANVHIEKDGFYTNDIKINDVLTANATYKNDVLQAFAHVKNFSYKDGKKLKFTLNADANAIYQNKMLYIGGDAYLKDLEAGYDLKSSRIAKDKDIVVLKPKRVEFDEKRFLDTVAMRINISNEGKAIYKSKEAYAPMDINLLYYKEYGKKPMMLGLVKTLGGYYDFEGKRFAMLPSQIAMTQTEPNNPYLDLTLRHIDKDAEIFIYVKEFASAPKISFSSNPAMSEKEIISYLLFGVDPDSSFSKSSNDAKYSSKAIGALSNALSRDLTSEFGIKLDKVEIAPTEVTDKTGRTTQTTKVEVGKRVTKDLTVTYKNDIESSVVFEYRINKNVNVESQAGRKSSVDIFYKKDY